MTVIILKFIINIVIYQKSQYNVFIRKTNILMGWNPKGFVDLYLTNVICYRIVYVYNSLGFSAVLKERVE